MEKPLEKAIVTLRPDLTLQVACGDIALDVCLDVDMALGLATALLAKVESQQPWYGRTDADILGRAHDTAFTLIRAVTVALRSASLSAADQAAAEELLRPAFTAAAIFLDPAFVAASFFEEALNGNDRTNGPTAVTTNLTMEKVCPTH